MLRARLAAGRGRAPSRRRGPCSRRRRSAGRSRSSRPSPKSATSIASRSAGVSTIPASASIAAARSRASASVTARRACRSSPSSCSASSARAWPDRVVAAEQQLRLAADRVAHVLELEPVGVLALELDPLDARRRGAARSPASLQCHGSSRKSEPSLPIASSSSRFGSAVPQSKRREHVAGEAQRPGEDPVGAGRPEPRLAEDALRLAAEQARAADAVTADVHQRAALDVGAQADVVLVVERVAERRADRAAARRSRPRRRAPRSRFVCGLWRYMNASLSSGPARSAASNAASTSSGWRDSGFSQSTCLPASSALIDHSQCIVFGSEM